MTPRGVDAKAARTRSPRISQDRLGAWRALLNAHAAATRAIEAELKEADLPPLGWYDLLWPLYTAPERRLRMNELAQQAVLSRTGLVRLVDRIEAAGLLRREPVPEDGRGAYATLTEAGLETLRRMWPVYARGIQRHFLEPVGDDAPRLRRVLERVACR
jgi:DNA-binding MarR family transcriptional regulator